MDFSSLDVSPEDLSYQVAKNAHWGTSFVPDERGRQEQTYYYEDIKSVYKMFADRISPEQEPLFLEELRRYRKANVSRRLDYLRARSRIMSSMITGPARFPVQRNEKRSRAYENKVKAFQEWRKKAIYRIGKALGLYGSNAISSDDKDALEQLQEKINILESKQTRMKEINALWRKGGNRPEALREANLTESERQEIMSNFNHGMADKPYPSWSLVNNKTNIRRLKDRLLELKKRRADETTEAVLNAVKIVENVEDNRVQIFFPDKPCASIRSELKHSGFHWSPSVGAWQRMRSFMATRRAREIVGLYNQQREA